MFYIIRQIQADGSDKLLGVFEAPSQDSCLNKLAREHGFPDFKTAGFDLDALRIKRCAPMPRDFNVMAFLNALRECLGLRTMSACMGQELQE